MARTLAEMTDEIAERMRKIITLCEDVLKIINNPPAMYADEEQHDEEGG